MINIFTNIEICLYINLFYIEPIQIKRLRWIKSFFPDTNWASRSFTTKIQLYFVCQILKDARHCLLIVDVIPGGTDSRKLLFCSSL